MSAKQKIKTEYDRCVHLAKNPSEAPELYDVQGQENISRYYTYRAEALGYALDQISFEEKSNG